MTVGVETLNGRGIGAVLSDVARLRIAVFRAWPYLYDGTLEHERDYLADFARADDAVVIVARDGAEIVGAATAAPLAGHSPAFVPLFAQRGIDPARVFYLGESVLLAAYRGRGIGHAFFDRREAHARRCRTADGGSFATAAFCGVVRTPDDPRRPAEYQPLDAFWSKRGYAKVDGLIGAYPWREIGEAAESDKPMQFWARALP